MLLSAFCCGEATEGRCVSARWQPQDGITAGPPAEDPQTEGGVAVLRDGSLDDVLVGLQDCGRMREGDAILSTAAGTMPPTAFNSAEAY